MSKHRKQTSSKGSSKSDILPDTALILDYEGKPTHGPNISAFPVPKNFSVLNLDLENPADLLQNMKDCIGLHRFWTYVSTDKRYRSPQGLMSWKVPKSGTYFQYVKYRNNWICLVEIASQSWLKGVITEKGVAEFQDSHNDETATYIRTNLPKIVLKSKGNYMQNVHLTKLGPRWLMESFDTVFHRITGDGDCGDLVEAFTVFVVHLWDTIRNDEVKDLVFASFDPSIFATRYLGDPPVRLMKKWKRCCRRATRCIENKEPYEVQRDTTPTSASGLLQVVRVLYRDDQDSTPIDADSMPVKLNGVDELRHGNPEGGHPTPDGGGHAGGSNPPPPEYPHWILDSFPKPNEQQGQGQRSYDWASKMASTAGTEDICHTRDEDQSSITGGIFTVTKTENTNPRGTERLQPLLLNRHLNEVVLNPREYDGGCTIDGSLKESTAWRDKILARSGYHMSFSIMKKFTDMQDIYTKVPVLSDISLDHVRGFTLVEPEKSCDIAQASIRFDLSRGTGVNIKDIAADERLKKLLTKLRSIDDHQAISKVAGGTTSLEETEVTAPLFISSQDTEFLEVHTEVMHDNQIGMMSKDGILYRRAKIISLTYWGIKPETSSSNTSSANDMGWIFSIHGPRGRNVARDQDMKASYFREKCSNIEAKRRGRSPVFYLVLLEVKMHHSLVKTDMIVIGDLARGEETGGLATDIGKTMMRRGACIQDGCSCWSEAADHDANMKGSNQGDESFSQGKLSWASGGSEPSGGDDQAGRKDGDNECDADKSSMLALLLAKVRLELDLGSMRIDTRHGFGRGESMRWIRSH